MTETVESAPRRGKPREECPENQLKVDGRVPPHDLDAEAAVLSACFARGAAAVDEVNPILAAADFYSEAHRRLFEACVDLAARGEPVDMITISSALKESQRIGQVGGIPYMMQISDAAPVVTTRHLQAYATTVRDRARLRRLALQLSVALARCYAPLSAVETEDFFGSIERDITALCSSRHAGELKPIGPITVKVMKQFDEHRKRGGGIVGIATGFDRLDRQMGGLHDGDLTIVAARPGIGKTSLVMGLCDNVTDREYAGAVFSLEMPEDQLVSRLLCTRGRVDLSKVRLGALRDTDWNKLTVASSDVFPKHIYIDDQSDQSLPMIRSKLRRLITKLTRDGKRLGVVIIDYLQLMRTRQTKGNDNRANLIGEITRGLKNLAKELRVPILLLCQLNREVEKREDKRPQLSDLRDSGEIEADADNVVFIYRDDYYFADSDEKNIAELLIAKQRNGPIGTVKLRFDKEWTRFDNLSEGDPAQMHLDDGQPYERDELYFQPNGDRS